MTAIKGDTRFTNHVMPTRDLIGCTFGDYTVLNYAGCPPGGGHRWGVRCACGATGTLSAGHLRKCPCCWHLRKLKLSPSEAAVARLVATGIGNKEIGRALMISERTVQTHLGAAFTKLGVSTRTELAAHLLQRLPEGTRPMNRAQGAPDFTQIAKLRARIVLLEAIADKAERLVTAAYPLQEQFNPESYEVPAARLLALTAALMALEAYEA